MDVRHTMNNRANNSRFFLFSLHDHPNFAISVILCNL